jgi:hypothetical protein
MNIEFFIILDDIFFVQKTILLIYYITIINLYINLNFNVLFIKFFLCYL